MVDTVSAVKKDKINLSKHYNEVVSRYKETNNVSLIIREFDISRNCLLRVLRDLDIYEPSSSESRKARSLAIKTAMQDKYGIDNPGQFESQRVALNARNSIPKTYLKLTDDFKIYCDQVDYITNKNRKNLIDSGYCFYTGIKFIDVDNNQVNPNDPLKRSIDHKMSKLEGFYSGFPAEAIGSLSNLVFCLRYCNSVKGNMNIMSFQLLAKQIRERLINEGHQSN